MANQDKTEKRIRLETPSTIKILNPSGVSNGMPFPVSKALSPSRGCQTA